MMEIIFSDIFIPFKNNDKVLIPYHGNYLRDCSKNECIGINGNLTFEMVRTRNKLIQPTSKDGITTLERLSFQMNKYLFQDY